MPTRTGTQSIERAVALIAEVSSRSRFGWRASDLANRLRLDRGTTHRMLTCLVRARLVRQRPEDRHYLPGPLLFELGLALPAYTAFQAACQPFVARIARRVPGYALLCVRSGDDAICIAAAGTPAYLGNAFTVGTRRPLVTSAAGLAMLIGLAPEEARRIAQRQLRDVPTRGEPSREALQRMWRRSADAGYGINREDTARGVNAVGVPLQDGDDPPFGSLSVAGTVPRLPATRFEEVAATLVREADGVVRLVRATLPEGTY